MSEGGLAWLTFVGFCVNCVTALLVYLTRKQAIEVHRIVNSRFDAQTAEITALHARIAELTK